MAGSIRAVMQNHLWMTWTTIAIKNEVAAWEGRAAGLATPEPDLMTEHEPSLVGLAAAAHALDGLYGELRDIVEVPRDVLDAWKANDTARHRRILGTVQHGFAIGKKQHEWAPELEWLFDARDAALHHEPKFTEGDPHPLVPGLTSAEVAFYRAEACTRSVNLLFDVLTMCVSKPKPATAAWTRSSKGVVEQRLSLRQKHPDPEG